MYQFKLDLKRSCPPANVGLGTNTSVEDVFCQVASSTIGTSDTVTDLTPVVVTSYQLFELNPELAAISVTSQNNLTLSDGDTLSIFSKVAAGEDADGVVVGGLFGRLVAKNQNGENVTLDWIVDYNDDCNNLNALQRGESLGWTVFDTPTDPVLLCAGVTHAPSGTPSSTPTGSPTSIALPKLLNMNTGATSRLQIDCQDTTDRITDIYSLISTLSDPQDVLKDGTPQYKATKWLLYEDERGLCPDDEFLLQRYTMAVIYFAFGGRKWRNCSSMVNNSPCVTESERYLSKESECDWFGSKCNQKGLMKQIQLVNNDLRGAMPSEITSLESLTRLELQDGGIVGPLPGAIGNMTKLEVIQLNGNIMDGQIPSSLYLLSNLKILDLSFNDFVGTLSDDIGNLEQLEMLQLDNNKFESSIPETVANLDRLVGASFEKNLFGGTMPTGACELVRNNLKFLSADCEGPDAEIICECCTSCF